MASLSQKITQSKGETKRVLITIKNRPELDRPVITYHYHSGQLSANFVSVFAEATNELVNRFDACFCPDMVLMMACFKREKA